MAGGGEQLGDVSGGAVDRHEPWVGQATGGRREQRAVDLDGVQAGGRRHRLQQRLGHRAGARPELDDGAGVAQRGALDDRVDQEA